MQSAISSLLEMGPLPDPDDASPDVLQKFQGLLTEIHQPITDEEALQLAKLLGPDDCFGLAWTLVHIIETAPGWPLKEAISSLNEDWRNILNDRCGN